MGVPELYLYSMDDPLVDFAYLDELVHHRKKTQHIRIENKVWAKSDHCQVGFGSHPLSGWLFR